MTLEYRCSNCGTLLQTTNADPLDAVIERLRARLDIIADIAEGSTTANSLPHIAKIARGVDEQKADQ